MAHELSIQNGKAEMFSGMGILPWHQNDTHATIVAGRLTAREAIMAASLNWEVRAYPVSVNGQVLPFPTEDKTEDSFQGICRADTGACLGIVKGRYAMIQNSDAFGFFDRLVGEGKARYETAGALRGGKVIWILAKLTENEVKIGKDLTRSWVLLVSSHDGSLSKSLQWVSERVVCANTLSIALNGKSNCIKIRHTESWKDKEEQARSVLGLAGGYFGELQTALAKLQDQAMDLEQMNDFVRLLYPSKNEQDVPTRTANMRMNTANLFTRGQGNLGQTRWDGLNAVSDYADHFSVIRGDNSTRLESSLTGSAAQLKQRAYDLLSAPDFTRQLLMTRPTTVLVPVGFAGSTN